eukprot:9301-Heterococcus_DN1.PRE.1
MHMSNALYSERVLIDYVPTALLRAIVMVSPICARAPQPDFIRQWHTVSSESRASVARTYLLLSCPPHFLVGAVDQRTPSASNAIVNRDEENEPETHQIARTWTCYSRSKHMAMYSSRFKTSSQPSAIDCCRAHHLGLVARDTFLHNTLYAWRQRAKDFTRGITAIVLNCTTDYLVKLIPLMTAM